MRSGRILIQAKSSGLIPELRPILDRMRANNYWMTDAVRDEILRQAGEPP